MEKHTIVNDLKANLGIASKVTIVKAAETAMADPEKLGVLSELALGSEAPYCWRAAWSLKHISTVAPHVLTPWLSTIVTALPDLPYDSQQGALLYVLIQTDFDIDEAGDLFDYCAAQLVKEHPHSYLKGYSVTLLTKMALKEPELKAEVRLMIEESSTHFKAKYARNKLKQALEKLK